MVENEVKKRPTGVTVLAVIEFIQAGFFLIFGIILLLMSIFVQDVDMTDLELSQDETSISFNQMMFGAFLFVGILFLLIGTLSLFIGIGFLKGQPWSRFISLFLIGISLVSVIFGLIIDQKTTLDYVSFTFSIIIYGFIGWYLGFNEKVINYFKN